LPRQPGTKESRYVHLLCGDVEESEREQKREPVSEISRGLATDAATIARLQTEIAALKNDVTELKQQFAQFRNQFE
jgi:uncharacterized protein